MADKGLARVEQLYANRGERASELREEGRKPIGYYCCQVPAELITAAGLLPFRITGSVKEPISQADKYLEVIMCPFCRNSFDMALRGKYDFLEGFVSPHSCDNIVKMYDIWKYNLKPSYSHFLNVPHTNSTSSLKFFRAEIDTFKGTLETFIGSEITAKDLGEAIKLHNEYRALVRELYELSKSDPPLVSGAERMKVLLAGLSLPVEEANELLRTVIDELNQRKDGPERKEPRLLVWGPEIDDVPFLQVIEEMGAHVVVDDLCVGTRPYWNDVEVSADPLEALSSAYLDKITCARTFWVGVETRKEAVDRRFGHLVSMARDYNVKGTILLSINYCDTFEFDSPEAKAALQEAGFPGMALEIDYTSTSIDWLKTRVQAFLEMIA
jgi:bzd-type benzoyl-CoA reductase N subunit